MYTFVENVFNIKFNLKSFKVHFSTSSCFRLVSHLIELGCLFSSESFPFYMQRSNACIKDKLPKWGEIFV